MTEADEFTKLMRTWHEVFMAHSMQDFIRFTRESGLSMSQIGALFCIRKTDTDVSDIGDNLGVTPGAASQMLERLFQQKLILRSEDPDDRRTKRLALTEKGQQVLNESIHVREQWLADLDKQLTPAEREQVTEAMRLLIAKAQAFSQKTK